MVGLKATGSLQGITTLPFDLGDITGRALVRILLTPEVKAVLTPEVEVLQTSVSGVKGVEEGAAPGGRGQRASLRRPLRDVHAFCSECMSVLDLFKLASQQLFVSSRP